MNRLKDLQNLYKSNRKLFNIIIFIVNIILVFLTALFTLIDPSRINVIILYILIGTLVYQLIKNP